MRPASYGSGSSADFFGKPVLLGYINGVALIVIASQLGKLFGITVDVDEFFPIIREVIGISATRTARPCF